MIRLKMWVTKICQTYKESYPDMINLTVWVTEIGSNLQGGKPKHNQDYRVGNRNKNRLTEWVFKT